MHETQGLSPQHRDTPPPQGVCSEPTCPSCPGQCFRESLQTALNTRPYCLRHIPSSGLSVAMTSSARIWLRHGFRVWDLLGRWWQFAGSFCERQAFGQCWSVLCDIEETCCIFLSYPAFPWSFLPVWGSVPLLSGEAEAERVNACCQWWALNPVWEMEILG